MNNSNVKNYSLMTVTELQEELKKLQEYRESLEWRIDTNKRSLKTIKQKIENIQDILSKSNQLKLF